jgi:glycosyltransferase involved in cell wall biosynthesis
VTKAPQLWIFNHYAGFPETVPAVRTYELAGRLSRAGWRVTVIACSFNHYTFSDDFPEERRAISETERDGVRWVFVKGAAYQRNGVHRLRNMVDYARRARRWAQRGGSPDIVIGTTVHPLAAETARRVAARKKARYFYEITDLWPATLVDLGALTTTSRVYQTMLGLERASLSKAAGVIGVLPGIPEYARDAHGLELQRFCYVPNGMVLQPRRDSEPLPEPGRVAWAGGFAAAHGMPSIVETARLLAVRHPGRFSIHLYGDGPEREPTQRAVAEAGLGNVVFHGLVPKASLGRELQKASVLLCTAHTMPVHRYGVSFNKIFDYFNAGRPVVYAVDSGNDPVAEAGAGVSVPAGDASAIAEAITALDALPAEELSRLGAAGREFLARQHSFDVLGERLQAFLTES